MTTRPTRRHALGLMGATAATPFLRTAAAAQSSRVTVGALPFTSHAASFVAQERGYFADAGLEVDFEFFQAAQPMAVAVASGDADYAVTAITGGLISLADKGAAKVIGGALSEEPGIDGQKILAAPGSGLESPADLDGRNWGITQSGSSFHYMGARIADAEEVELTYRPLQKVGAIVGALKSGQIDAWSIVPHIAASLTEGGEIRRIGRVADYLPDYQVTTVFTSAEAAANRRDRTEAFLEAFARGAADYNAALVDREGGESDVEEMVRLIHTYVYSDRPYAEARPLILNGAMRINADAALNTDSVEDQLDWFKAEGLIDQSITFETLVDPSYVESA